MKLVKTELPEVVLIELDLHEDERGHFFERFHEQRFAQLGLPTRFRQDNQSRSHKNVLRGLHYQLRRPQGKLVQCIRGAVFDVAIDLRVGSPTFSKWVGVELSENHQQLLWIPPGFAHGLCVTSGVADVLYQCTDVYDPSDEYGIIWSDPDLCIKWPVTNPIVSERDRTLPALAAARAHLPRYEASQVGKGTR